MSGPTLAASILNGFSSIGWVGISTPQYAAAIGNGAMLEILGKPFDTIDTGTGPGTGIGSGVGLTGIVGALVATQIQTEIISFTGLPPTPDMIKMTNIIGDSIESEVALATLITSHSPVYAGTATIVPGSIAVTGTSIGGSIKNTGIGTGFLGKDWPDMAGAIGNGIGDSFLIANSAITITPSSTTPPPAPAGPIPNTISPAGVLG